MSNWLRDVFSRANAASEAVESTGRVLVRKNSVPEENGRYWWHIADPVSGYPVLGDLANEYMEFRTKKEAVEFVRIKGFKSVFD